MTHSINDPFVVDKNYDMIKFGMDFNNKITFKMTVRKIVFGDVFNHWVEFPEGVEEIIFGDAFNLLLKQYPKSLKKLSFGKKYNQPLTNLPSMLQELGVGEDYDLALIIPCTVTTLSFCPKSFEKFTVPYFVKELTIDGNFNGPLPELPKLEKLVIKWEHNWDINTLPISLKHLELSRKFNREVNFSYLKNLTILIFGDSFNHQIFDEHLPLSLTYLQFGASYNHDINLTNKHLKNIVLHAYYKGNVDTCTNTVCSLNQLCS